MTDSDGMLMGGGMGLTISLKVAVGRSGAVRKGGQSQSRCLWEDALCREGRGAEVERWALWELAIKQGGVLHGIGLGSALEGRVLCGVLHVQ